MADAERSGGRLEWWLLATALAAAALLRLLDLGALPPAHYRDVALTALDAMRAASGHPCLHYTYDEGLYSNIMGLLFVAFNPSDWTVRLPGALFGILTVLGVHRLGSALHLRRAGLYGAALLAVCFWHLVLSRSGFRAILLPLLLVYSMAFLVEGLERRQNGRLALAGLLLGLGIHVYPAVRFAPLMVPGALLAALGTDKEAWRRSLRGVCVFVAAAVLIALPMLLHYVSHPEHLNYPHRVVSVFSPKLEEGQASVHLQRNIFLTLGMFHLRGDENWRHGISGAPLLDPLTGILFVIGFIASLRARAGGAGALAIVWLFAMLLPNLLSVEGVPHGLRSSGTLPAIALLAGIGMVAAEDVMARRLGRRAAVALILAALTGLGCWTAYRYFVVWGEDPRVVEAHDGAYRAAARALLSAPPGVETFLLANGKGFRAYGQPAEVHPYLFEMRDAPPVILGPRDAGRLVMNGRPALVAMVRRDERALDLIKRLNPGAPVRPVEAPGLSPESPVYRIN